MTELAEVVARRDSFALGQRTLQNVVLRGVRFGCPVGDAPLVLVIGGITASPYPLDHAEHTGWWPAMGAPELLDPQRQTILTFRWPGSGSQWDGMGDPDAQSLSVSDLADLLELWLTEAVGSRSLRAVGASLGGLVALALTQRHPERVERLLTISAGARPDAWGTAVRHLQRELVRDGLRGGDATLGMVRARQLGMVTYRGREEMDRRFASLAEGQSHPPVAGYLEHHGKKFASSFSAQTFLLLSEAIDRCDLTDGAGSLAEALRGVRAQVFVIGVDSDLLFPWSLQVELHRALQRAGVHAALYRMTSIYGHDAFLADQQRLASLVRHTGFFETSATPTKEGAFAHVELPPSKKLRIGMLGCGVVGQGVLALLAERREELLARYNTEFEVTRIVVRDLDAERGPHATAPRSQDPRSLVTESDVDVVVEVAGGVEPIEPVLCAALAAGKPVVTANKNLLSERLDALAALAERTGVPIACEAAVAAAVPILRFLNHRSDDVRSLIGIVNGTSNYLITRIEQDELPLEEALAQARALGLAEADPSADVEGLDAAAKLSILLYRAFGVSVPPASLKPRGMTWITPIDCDHVGAMGMRLRHVVFAERDADGIRASVEPMALPSWHLLAGVEEEYNAVYLAMEHSGDLSFFGKGAGALPTASAVVSDLVDIAQGNAAVWPEPTPSAVRAAADTPRRHYMRVSYASHAQMEQRVESALRRAGLTPQNRTRYEHDEVSHLGLIVAPSTDEQVRQACETLRGLARVSDTVWAAVLEG